MRYPYGLFICLFVTDLYSEINFVFAIITRIFSNKIQVDIKTYMKNKKP